MLEKQLAKDFNEMFKEFPIHTPQNRQAGWPDKGIQVHSSRLVWFELKVIQLRYGATTCRIPDLTPNQCAWLAKWQRAGGFCYLFLGFTNYEEQLNKYGILRVGRWDLWLKVRQQPISLDQLLLYTEHTQEIMKWFRDMFIPQSLDRKVVAAQ